MRTSPEIAVVLERCNRLLALVIDAVDLKHFLPGHKLLTRRRMLSSFCTAAICCLLFPKITTRLHISVSQHGGYPKPISTMHPQYKIGQMTHNSFGIDCIVSSDGT